MIFSLEPSSLKLSLQLPSLTELYLLLPPSPCIPAYSELPMRSSYNNGGGRPLLPSPSSTFQPSKTSWSSSKACARLLICFLVLNYFLPGQNITKLVRSKYYPWAQTTTKPTSPKSCHDHHVQAINYLFCVSLFQIINQHLSLYIHS